MLQYKSISNRGNEMETGQIKKDRVSNTVFYQRMGKLRQYFLLYSFYNSNSASCERVCPRMCDHLTYCCCRVGKKALLCPSFDVYVYQTFHLKG